MMIAIPQNILASMLTTNGQSVSEISEHKSVMLVFLRHFGCTFCREALEELSTKREEFQKNGTELVFVHMSDEATANKYFERYNLKGVANVSDPYCHYYKEFGLVKGNFRQLFGLNQWIRGFEAGVVRGHGIGQQLGDGFQMPGVFLIQAGEVKDQFIHQSASDKPNYEQLLNCCGI